MALLPCDEVGNQFLRWLRRSATIEEKELIAQLLPADPAGQDNAPTDGKLYGRKGNQWDAIEVADVEGLPEALAAKVDASALGALAALDTVTDDDIDPDAAIAKSKLAQAVQDSLNNADEAHGWGDHSQAGYATADTQYAAGAGLDLDEGEFSVKFGDTAGTAVEGNDPRLVADARSYVAAEGQDTFSVNFSGSNVQVFRNGLLLPPTDVTYNNGTSITLNAPCAAGDIVSLIGGGSIAVADAYTKAEVDNRLELLNPSPFIVNTHTTATLLGRKIAYAVDTSSGPVNLTLPASPSVGDIVEVYDYARTFTLYPCTVKRNGKKMMGMNEDYEIDISNRNKAFTYIDEAKGWYVR